NGDPQKLKEDIGTPYNVNIIIELNKADDTGMELNEKITLGEFKGDYPNTVKAVRNAPVDDGRIALITIYLQ
ncbi:hypothetical protein JXB01_01620, partial [Candidatus Micrarchaeota archaeon]|nr:hypothetical protein [Candidatus Micrarchaeota archaeon]